MDDKVCEFLLEVFKNEMGDSPQWIQDRAIRFLADDSNGRAHLKDAL